MAAYEIDEAGWALKLAPQLTGKAQQAYAAMEASQATGYESLKAAILRRYEINEETYRTRFRSTRRKEGEMQTELVTRLTDSAKKWLKRCKSMEEQLTCYRVQVGKHLYPHPTLLVVRPFPTPVDFHHSHASWFSISQAPLQFQWRNPPKSSVGIRFMVVK